jgi:hypothetical protein
MPKTETFYDVITAAVADLSTHGYDSVERLDFWLKRIRAAAEASLTPEYILERELKRQMGAIFERLVDKASILKRHPGVSRFTLANVRPALRAELDRRTLASAQLIRLNRTQAIEKTLQRFSGWATSIPVGGSGQVDKRETKDDVRKSLAQLPFEERRVAIDQGHKFASSLSNILARDGGAIAVIWNSHWRQANYDFRETHKERDGLVYLLRGNWAQERGLVKPGPAGYYDQVTAFGEEVFCRCWGTYLYAVRDLPPDMLTAKGRGELASVRVA